MRHIGRIPTESHLQKIIYVHWQFPLASAHLSCSQVSEFILWLLSLTAWMRHLNPCRGPTKSKGHIACLHWRTGAPGPFLVLGASSSISSGVYSVCRILALLGANGQQQPGAIGTGPRRRMVKVESIWIPEGSEWVWFAQLLLKWGGGNVAKLGSETEGLNW